MYVDDSDKYYEILNLYNDTFTFKNYKKSDLSSLVLVEIGKYLQLDTSQIGDIGETHCACEFMKEGIESVALDKIKKGFVQFCQGGQVKISYLLYFNQSDSNKLKIFSIVYPKYNLIYDSAFYNAILTKNVIVGEYHRF